MAPDICNPVPVVIVGGGLSGATVAFHLARARPEGAPPVVLVEPRAEPGRGLAYSTPAPEHRLNVPDLRMTLRTDRPDDFRRWLCDPGAPALPPGSATLSGDLFVPRAVFGAYVGARLAPLLASGRIVHVRDRAVSARRGASGFEVGLAGGGAVRGARLVLAVSHPPPGLPGELAGLAGDPALVPDPYAPGALAGIGVDERALVLGSGLTGADIVASFEARGHRGPVTMLSRHGRRSQPHGRGQAATAEDFSLSPETTARGLLRRIRAALARDAAAGLSWHAVFDRLRLQGPTIWAALPLAERARLVRHLRGLWDVHRFRIAPQTHEAVERMLVRRRLRLVAGRITGVRRGPAGIEIALRLRGEGEALTLACDRVVLATGPGHRGVIAGNPVLADLAGQGLLRADPLRLGLDTDAAGAALDATGRAQEDLLVAGPLARAAVGELMGLPEVTAFAERVVARLLAAG
ncbi:FAD/NAD(P)-binding protein [Pseudogemmobacter sonorensis]|uniref:FAD/NAD(P)-binding protein n=1 Tax=Pseudogemmobacter sonorensis TaxID=2989681 RepID=UPI0036B5C8B0